MKKFILNLFFLFLTTFSALFCVENAQTRFGIYGSYNFFNFKFGDNYLTSDPLCTSTESLNNHGFSLGIASRIPLSFLSNNVIFSSVEIDADYSKLKSYESKVSDLYPNLMDNSSNQINSKLVYNYEMQFSLLNISMLYSVEPFNTGINISIGLTYSASLSDNFKMTAELQGTGNERIDTMLASGCWTGRDIKYSSNFQNAEIINENVTYLRNHPFYLNLGIGYDIKLYSILINPFIKYRSNFEQSEFRIGCGLLL